LLDHLDYDGFGNVTESNTAAGDRYKYTAREYDYQYTPQGQGYGTGLQYNRERYYDSKTGRWTSEDPMGFGAADANLYRYVGNNAPNAIDPSGLLDAKLELPLKAAELAKTRRLRAGRTAKRIRAALFGPKADIGAALSGLKIDFGYNVRNFELHGIVNGFKSDGRKAKAGIQKAGRIALIWWDTKKKEYKRSTDGNSFDARTDRLEFALAVLDTKSIRAKTPKGGITGIRATGLPPAWKVGKRYEQGHAIGGAFGGSGLISSGNFTPEPDTVNAARGRVEAKIVEHLKKNPAATVAVLVLYRYSDKTSRIPIGYDYYAMDNRGTLDRLFEFTDAGFRGFIIRDRDFGK
jgi:RHS repeat-associated protein